LKKKKKKNDKLSEIIQAVEEQIQQHEEKEKKEPIKPSMKQSPTETKIKSRPESISKNRPITEKIPPKSTKENENSIEENHHTNIMNNQTIKKIDFDSEGIQVKDIMLLYQSKIKHTPHIIKENSANKKKIEKMKKEKEKPHHHQKTTTKSSAARSTRNNKKVLPRTRKKKRGERKRKTKSTIPAQKTRTHQVKL